jgi:hypothetical protein
LRSGRRPFFLFWPLAGALFIGCSHREIAPDAGQATESDDAFVWPIGSVDPNASPPPRKGMVYIPPGTLSSGTPADKVPRLADKEPAAEPVAMRGFYMDEYAYPNEAGAIPKTGMNRDEAANLCTAQGKRLCTELEWERACKGPGNATFEYGDQYRAAECATGGPARLSPSGLRVTCRSAFGVHDMHGGPWEWTSSTWHRGGDPASGVARGGNSDAGELSARCANAMPIPIKLRRSDVGARCCAGDVNEAEIKLTVTRGKPLASHPTNSAMMAELSRAVREKMSPETAADQPFRIDWVYAWHPVGNEEIVLALGCVGKPPRATCGVGVVRAEGDDGAHADADLPAFLGFAGSGIWPAVVRPDSRGHDVWVYGGDGIKNFRRRIAYVWGKVAIGEPEKMTTHATTP